MPRAGHRNRRSMFIFCSLSAAFNSLVSWRILAVWPPVKALREAFSLPLELLGPVDCSQGLHFCIAARCCCRCSNVQVRAAIVLHL